MMSHKNISFAFCLTAAAMFCLALISFVDAQKCCNNSDCVDGFCCRGSCLRNGAPCSCASFADCGNGAAELTRLSKTCCITSTSVNTKVCAEFSECLTQKSPESLPPALRPSGSGPVVPTSSIGLGPSESSNIINNLVDTRTVIGIAAGVAVGIVALGVAATATIMIVKYRTSTATINAVEMRPLEPRATTNPSRAVDQPRPQETSGSRDLSGSGLSSGSNS